MLQWAWRPAGLRGEAVGDALSLVFRWVGPTREVVTASLELVVAHAPEDLSLSAPYQAEPPFLTMATHTSPWLHPPYNGFTHLPMATPTSPWPHPPWLRTPDHGYTHLTMKGGAKLPITNY